MKLKFETVCLIHKCLLLNFCYTTLKNELKNLYKSLNVAEVVLKEFTDGLCYVLNSEGGGVF